MPPASRNSQLQQPAKSTIQGSPEHEVSHSNNLQAQPDHRQLAAALPTSPVSHQQSPRESHAHGGMPAQHVRPAAQQSSAAPAPARAAFEIPCPAEASSQARQGSSSVCSEVCAMWHDLISAHTVVPDINVLSAYVDICVHCLFACPPA